ncbi:hypothetical protein GCM10022225_64150 [Plantactinospora mayteni]|uniref:PPE family domain-containing protein n=1 Tax=Plantactinospora mayteni TaxID=566021 RepID=A0ABQ4F0B4_9ACTN|nr:hypothetical protein [Plantactinospora mayteni]GIH00344.1 hypothetical protein Pma05_69160 [Plantactinospora mayteni]
MATNWEQYTLDDIAGMFNSVDLGALGNIATHWKNYRKAIGEGAQTLDAETRGLAGHWKGKAASAFVDSAGQAVDRMEQWRKQAEVRAAGIEMVAMKVESAQNQLLQLVLERDQALARLREENAGKQLGQGYDLLGYQESQLREAFDRQARAVAADAAGEIARLTPWESPGPYVGLQDVVAAPTAPTSTNVDAPPGGPPAGPPGTTGPNTKQPDTNPPDTKQPNATRTDVPIVPPQNTTPQNSPFQAPEQQTAPPQSDVPQVGQPPTAGDQSGTDVPPPPTAPNMPGSPGVPVVPPLVPYVPGGRADGSSGTGSGGSGIGSGGVGGGPGGGAGAGRIGSGAPAVSTDLLGRLAGAEGAGTSLVGAVRPPVGAAGAPAVPPMIPPMVPPAGGHGGALSGRQARRTARGGGAPRVVGQEPVTTPQSISGRPADKKKAPPARQQESEQQSVVTYST